MAQDGQPVLTEVTIDNEVFYKIANVDRMRPFFMSIVSDANHWLFVSSNGGISAGRKNADYALLPYYTDDKITESAEHTGSKTILQVFINGNRSTWEPFSIRSEALFTCERNVYKNRYGNKIIFEEYNTDLQICFRYEWNFSTRYGFIRKASLINQSAHSLNIQLLDGLQNILPYGVNSDLLNTTSNLADAYKWSRLLPASGIGIFSLSAIIVDKAEPSEALKANIVWSLGLANPQYLLSSAQLNSFRKGKLVQQETDNKGERGAYFITSKIKLAANEEKKWMLIANVNQTQAAVIQLADHITQQSDLAGDIEQDIAAGTKSLLGLAAASDGLQCTADDLQNTRHYSNTLFNIMRGGIFDNNYSIEKNDLRNYLQKANAETYTVNQDRINNLPETFSLFTLKETAEKSGDAAFVRLSTEYLPLKFSRRHGDPSRPWNKFTINTHSETDGSKILDYEGNWRDIFQNWEALAHAYPAFIEGMIYKFLNASTFDGYNPYRITKDGFDWETIEPDNPWSYIGYWGDHQVIYLQKFLEFIQNHYPDRLYGLLTKEQFVYANVPYTIKPYQQILRDPKDTIGYNHTADKKIQERKRTIGADGALLVNANEQIHVVNFTEKILATLLAKITNLVPGGGIWMNTQRPEWNDANNALVGNGLSMVTLYYLRRFLHFLKPLFTDTQQTDITLSAELADYFTEVVKIFDSHSSLLPTGLANTQKKKMLDELGDAASRYRTNIYKGHFSGNKSTVPVQSLHALLDTTQQFIEEAISQNQRQDGLYHTYNLLSYDHNELTISHLSEMLEGQVAVLSSGYLSAAGAVAVLDALKESSLYRPDQRSYILYPNKELPSFLEKNNVPAETVQSISLLKQLLTDNQPSIIEKDIHGGYHFNGNFKNANDLAAALQQLHKKYQSLVEQDTTAVLQLFEQVFNHKAFTGRSGTFFAYEGLGSIYWHMVSKLLLAVQETYLSAVAKKENPDLISRLHTHYYAIREGIGVHKPASLYGAFPTDPYSHTPLHKGAQQPGMTGQVKEDIISRFGELGVVVNNGQLGFNPNLLRKEEFIQTAQTVSYININGEEEKLQLPVNSLLFTYCQVPVIYQLASVERMEVEKAGSDITKTDTPALTAADSQHVFQRNGTVKAIRVFWKAERFK